MDMKIQIVKKAVTTPRGSDPCPWLLEVPPEAGKK
jgi:hypothetical protein